MRHNGAAERARTAPPLTSRSRAVRLRVLGLSAA